MKKTLLLLLFCLHVGSLLMGQTFEVTLPSELAKQPLDGRLLLMLSKNPTGEPRFQISDGQETQQILGVDVNEWKPGTTVKVGVNAVGYPLETINKIKSGQYSVQALLHVYETFNRKDGHVVKLPMDRGEGQHWNMAPGNIYSQPVAVNFKNDLSFKFNIKINKIIPPIKEPEDTKYVKHIKIID